MDGKRTLEDVLMTVGVGAGMAANVCECTNNFHKYGEKIAPRIQEYVGSMGSGAIEYGLPAMVAIATAWLGVLAVKATDQYLLNRKGRAIL